MNDVGCFSPLSLALSYLHPDSVSMICASFLSVPTSPSGIALPYYLFLFALTFLLELPFYRSVRTTLILNLATHPAVIWLFPYLFEGQERRTMVLWAELFAILLEFVLLFKLFRYPWKRALGLTLVANLFSWWAGQYLVRWLG